MTLLVSVRVPDGIIVGADSLATISVSRQEKAVRKITCPECGHEHDVEVKFQLPSGGSTLPYALKLIPMFERVAVATTGSYIIGAKTTFSLLAEFEAEHQFKSIPKLAKALGAWFHQRLRDAGVKTDEVAEGREIMGFQVSGYEEDGAKTISVKIGKNVTFDEYVDFGVTISGETAVVKQLWQLQRDRPQIGSAYQTWSVLDAVEYVKFAISTTAALQRFSMIAPSVGGDIDIALLTPQRHFRWIQKKPLVDLMLSDA